MHTIYNSSLTAMDLQLNFVSDMLLVTIQGVNFFLGLPLNTYMIFLLTRAGGLDEAVLFVVSQCVSEILFAVSAPVYILCLSVIQICSLEFLGFVVGIFLTARPVFQSCVCVERYLAVVHPVIFLKLKPLRYRVMTLTALWIFVLPFSFTAMLTFPYTPYPLYGILYLVILGVELFCCASVLRALRQPGPGERGLGREEIRKKTLKNHKAFEIVFFNLLTFLLQSVPTGTVLSLERAVRSQGVFNMSITLSILVNIGAGYAQVLFYLFKSGKLTLPMLAKPPAHGTQMMPTA